MKEENNGGLRSASALIPSLVLPLPPTNHEQERDCKKLTLKENFASKGIKFSSER